MTSKPISRDDLLVLLSSMGVVLPKDNKLPEEELNKRLKEALDTSQEYSDVIKKEPVDPLSLPKWSSEEKTLYQASQRDSLLENLGASFPSNAVSLAKEYTFKEMKQTLLGVAYTYDLGVKEISFLTHDDTWGIFIRIIGVYCLKNDIPLTYILYKELKPTSDTPLDVLRRQVRLEQDDVTSRISDLEGRAILTLFEQNGARLDPKLLQLAESQTVKHSGFRPSFILPLCPINMRNLGSLTKDPGCEQRCVLNVSEKIGELTSRHANQ
ncbi:hypothetical protein JR316_0007714 [Psilocybe cubensis]|uniref:Uncharacterized protein n=1 Tax=Psilocybe cubensis TaxID=181762 RepID=A0ACB8GVX6_PSICU|nr:hypothetical protein JR316_0007714 [Psilocybe cubensis]KAH9479135.1 hypothetical protein JR316_0007714 [Psilocybe cubensis]